MPCAEANPLARNSRRLFLFSAAKFFSRFDSKKTRPTSTKDGDDHGEQPRTSTLDPIYL